MNRQDERVIRTIYLIVDDYIRNGGNLKYDGRNIGTLLFEHSTSYSGKTSRAALIQKFNKKENWCKEHIWPRQRAGEKMILEFVERGSVDIGSVTKKVREFTVVNRVTKRENMLLKEHQGRKTFTTPENAYEKVGIKMVSWQKGLHIKNLPRIYPHFKRFLRIKTRKK